jgi:hypothetical protein
VLFSAEFYKVCLSQLLRTLTNRPIYSGLIPVFGEKVLQNDILTNELGYILA